MIRNIVICLIPGWGAPAGRLKALAQYLSDVSIVMSSDLLELREQSKHPYSASAYREGIHHMLDQLKHPALLVGWSMGGMAALEAASHRFAAGLVLMGSTARFCSDGPEYPHGARRKELKELGDALEDNPERSLHGFYQHAANPSPLGTDQLKQFTRESLSMGMEHLQAGLKYLDETDLRDRLDRIDIPTLCLHGSDDAVVPVTAAEYMNELIPQSTLMKFAGCGHDLPWREPEWCAYNIKTFAEVFA